MYYLTKHYPKLKLRQGTFLFAIESMGDPPEREGGRYMMWRTEPDLRQHTGFIPAHYIAEVPEDEEDEDEERANAPYEKTEGA